MYLRRYLHYVVVRRTNDVKVYAHPSLTLYLNCLQLSDIERGEGGVGMFFMCVYERV